MRGDDEGEERTGKGAVASCGEGEGSLVAGEEWGRCGLDSGWGWCLCVGCSAVCVMKFNILITTFRGSVTAQCHKHKCQINNAGSTFF